MTLQVIYLLFLFSLPFEGYGIPTATVTLSFPNILISLIYCTICFKIVTGKHINLSLSNPVKLAIGMFFLMTISDLIHFSTFSLSFTFRRIGSWMTFFCPLFLDLDLRMLNRSLISLSFGVLIVSIMTILHSSGLIQLPVIVETTRLSFPGIFHQRTLGVPIDYGLYGMIMLSVVPILFCSVLSAQPILFKRRLFSLTILLLTLLGIFLSESRSTWLAVTIALTITAFMLLRARYFTYVAILVPIIIFIYNSDLLLNIVKLTLDISPGGYTVRNEMNEIAFAHFKDHPLLGIGYIDIHTRFGVHNSVFHQLMRTGLAGTIPYISLLVLCGVNFLRAIATNVTPSSIMFSIALASSFIGMIIELQFFLGFSAKIFWLFMGISFCLFNLEGLDKHPQ